MQVAVAASVFDRPMLSVLDSCLHNNKKEEYDVLPEFISCDASLLAVD